ncbi:Fatty acid synthase [Holothuria leucospilota]|uniref:Fatty acid synthase n=1 Tax=Holothuria leucospilota TaxID=206669 RepID=A0A9Q0YQR6_HOLLE|nr:Fatty acid synthase [Holothuria leucospilota]
MYCITQIISHQALRSKSWLSTSYPEELWEKPEAMWLSTSYLVNNLVSPVLFHDAVCKIPPSAIVIEIAPHGSMKVLLQRTIPSDCDYLSLMNMKEPDNLHYFLSAVGKLFSMGISLDISKLYPLIKYPVGTGTPPLSPGIKWDHSTEWAVPSWEDFILDSSGDRATIWYEIG